MHTARAVRAVVDKLVDVFMVTAFGVIFLVVLAQIYYRYVLVSPLVWSEELSRFIFIWVSLIGWVLATRNGTHIRITFVEDRFPPRFRRILVAFFRLLTLGFLGVLVYYGSIMSLRTFGRAAVTIPMVPMGLFYAALPVSGILGIFYVVYDTLLPGEAKNTPAVME